MKTVKLSAVKETEVFQYNGVEFYKTLEGQIVNGHTGKSVSFTTDIDVQVWSYCSHPDANKGILYDCYLGNCPEHGQRNLELRITDQHVNDLKDLLDKIFWEKEQETTQVLKELRENEWHNIGQLRYLLRTALEALEN